MKKPCRIFLLSALLILSLAVTGCSMTEDPPFDVAAYAPAYVDEYGTSTVVRRRIGPHAYVDHHIVYGKLIPSMEISPPPEVPPFVPKPLTDDTVYQSVKNAKINTGNSVRKVRRAAPPPIPSSTPARQDDASAWQTPPVEPKDVEKL